MIIYKTQNLVNQKNYIGQTNFTLERRQTEHILKSKSSNPTSYFHKALKKYGPENFSWEILCECDSKEELDEMEFHYIKQFNCFGKHGYNLTLGGEGSIGYVPTEETRKKISEKTKEGLMRPDVRTRKSIRVTGEGNPMFGKVHSDETLKKMRLAKKGQCIGSKNATVRDAGLYLVTFPDGHQEEVKNLREFCRERKIGHTQLYKICNEKRDTPFLGFWVERLKMCHQKMIEKEKVGDQLIPH